MRSKTRQLLRLRVDKKQIAAADQFKNILAGRRKGNVIIRYDVYINMTVTDRFGTTVEWKTITIVKSVGDQHNPLGWPWALGGA
jgi:hypothetical protein